MIGVKYTPTHFTMYGPVQLEWKGEDVKFTQITRTADLVHNGEFRASPEIQTQNIFREHFGHNSFVTNER